MVNLALSSWNMLKLWFQFLFELYKHKCFILLWETQFLLLPSAMAFSQSIAGPHFSCCLQPPGTVWIQHRGSSPPAAPSLSYQSAWAAAAGAAALGLPHFFTSLLPINFICSWARPNYHTNDFGQCQHFQCALIFKKLITKEKCRIC